jgi:hypothetical protein
MKKFYLHGGGYCLAAIYQSQSPVEVAYKLPPLPFHQPYSTPLIYFNSHDCHAHALQQQGDGCLTVSFHSGSFCGSFCGCGCCCCCCCCGSIADRDPWIHTNSPQTLMFPNSGRHCPIFICPRQRYGASNNSRGGVYGSRCYESQRRWESVVVVVVEVCGVVW